MPTSQILKNERSKFTEVLTKQRLSNQYGDSFISPIGIKVKLDDVLNFDYNSFYQDLKNMTNTIKNVRNSLNKYNLLRYSQENL